VRPVLNPLANIRVCPYANNMAQHCENCQFSMQLRCASTVWHVYSSLMPGIAHRLEPDHARG